MVTLKDRTALLEKIMEDFGYTNSERSWPFMEDGHRKIASIHAKDLYDAIKVLDWDELQQ